MHKILDNNLENKQHETTTNNHKLQSTLISTATGGWESESNWRDGCNFMDIIEIQINLIVGKNIWV